MSIDQTFLDRFANYNPDGDGIAEINRLELMSFESPEEVIPTDSPLVLVLVEPRLLEEIDQAVPEGELVGRLERFKEDLWLEGYTSRFILADVYGGAAHQDGRSLLAIRTVLRSVRKFWRKLQGVILVGSFPEAMLVRRWVWRKESEITIDGQQYTGYLRIVPEIVSERSDIVLEDLTGRWHDIYVEGPEDIELIEAVPDNSVPANWPVDGQVFQSQAYNRSSTTFEDFFWIRDDDYRVVSESHGVLRLVVSTKLRHPELAWADRSMPNPIARPDIHVSRINPLHIASDPDPNEIDINGKRFLATDGKPQAVDLTHTPNKAGTLAHRNPALERELLCDYFDRNHNYRRGELALIQRPAAIAYPHSDFSADGLANYLDDASSSFGTSVSFNDGTLLDYVDFLKTPAVLKGVSAHSSPWNTKFGTNYATADLEASVGGRPWRWKLTSSSGSVHHYEPSLDDQGPHADLYLHRTIYENQVLEDSEAAFYIHTGCQVNSPGGGGAKSYDAAGYGGFQNAEGILFYLKGLSLVSRAKVFYDQPRGFPAAFGASLAARFGDGLEAYFDLECQDSSLGKFEKAASSKRAYTWSIIGDWTLRLQPVLVEKDCIPVDWRTTDVQAEPSGWLVTDGYNRMLICPNQAEALRAKQVIKHYRLDFQCFVGRPDASMKYWLCGDKAPIGGMSGEDAIPFDLYNLTAVEVGSLYIIEDGVIRMFACPSAEEAEQALQTIRMHRFNRQCFIGRPDASMIYFRR